MFLLSATSRIFAGMIEPVRQGLVYQMQVGAPAELAMVLPLAVVLGAAADAVKFLDF